jgi:hypothetical protein
MKQNTWEDQAACAPERRSKEAKDLDWFSSNRDEKYKARAICQGECDVRKECLQFALDKRMLHGIWGGVDDYEIRRAMSVDAVGDPLQRNRLPRCPYCMSRNLEIGGQKVKALGYLTRCLEPECGLTWYIATIPTKLKKKAG